MYTIQYRFCEYSKSTNKQTFQATDARGAAEGLIDLSRRCPISMMHFETRKKPFEPKRVYYYHNYSYFDRQKRWVLDYSPAELAKKIRSAMPKGGVIKAWHDPYFGTRL